MTTLAALLDQFAACVARNDGTGLANLFTADGTYDDYFFGPHRGRPAIAAMLARFHQGGEQFRWEFYALLGDAHSAYARYRFSYLSKVPESAGKPVLFEGMAALSLKDGLIAHYAEVFDRGTAFVQLGFPAGKVARLLEKYTVTQLLDDCHGPRDSYDLLGGLFVAMNTPGRTPGGRYKGVEYFNGGLFAEPVQIELASDELNQLQQCAREDWSKVRPEIFGTLFERVLDPVECHKLGAHCTPRAYVERLVMPTIIEPLREEWDSVRAATVKMTTGRRLVMTISV